MEERKWKIKLQKWKRYEAEVGIKKVEDLIPLFQVNRHNRFTCRYCVRSRDGEVKKGEGKVDGKGNIVVCQIM